MRKIIQNIFTKRVLKQLLLVFSVMLFPLFSFADEKPGILKNLGSKIKNAASSIPVIGNWIKSIRSEEKLELQREQLETSQSSLKKIQEFAKDLLEVKRKIEEGDAIRKNAQRLYKDLLGANYGKVSLGITESIVGIDLNPGAYIPNIDATSKLKRDCSFSLYREKALLRNVDSFSNRSQRFLNIKNPSKGIIDVLRDLREAAEQSERSQIDIKESNNKLIAIYERQIKELAEQNKQIEEALSDKRFEKNDPAQYFNLKNIQSKNNIMAAGLIERINKIRRSSNKVSQEDKKAIAELAGKAFYQELLRKKLADIKRRNSK